MSASHESASYRTRVAASVALDRLELGHTLPRAATVASARLDGEPVEYRTRQTNRGLEVLVEAPADGESHELVVETG